MQSCFACGIIQLSSLVLSVVRAVHKFDSSLINNGVGGYILTNVHWKEDFFVIDTYVFIESICLTFIPCLFNIVFINNQ